MLQSELMARRRYQRGSLRFIRGEWVGRWREDVRASDGRVLRRQRQRRLGSRTDLPTQRLARRAFDTLLAEVNAPGYVPRAAATLWSVVERWERTVLSQQRASTQSALAPQLAKHVRDSLGAFPICEITAERVQQWAAGLEGSPKTVRNIVGAVCQVWESARAWGYVSAPFPAPKLPRAAVQRGRVFSAEQVRRIVEAAPEPYATLYVLLAETGMRAGEALCLTGRRVESDILVIEEGIVKGVRGPTKSGRARTVRLSAALGARLRALGAAPDTLIWRTQRGRPWFADRLVREHLAPLLVTLGIPHAGLHAFRHANATELLRAGVPLRTVQTRLGHSDPATTLRVYAHVVDTDQGWAVEAAQAAFGAQNMHSDVRRTTSGRGKLLKMKKKFGETAGTRIVPSGDKP